MSLDDLQTVTERIRVQFVPMYQQADSSDIGPISTGGQFGHWSYLNRRTVRTLVLSQQADSSDIGPISTGGQFGHWSYLNCPPVEIGPMSELSAC